MLREGLQTPHHHIYPLPPPFLSSLNLPPRPPPPLSPPLLLLLSPLSLPNAGKEIVFPKNVFQEKSFRPENIFRRNKRSSNKKIAKVNWNVITDEVYEWPIICFPRHK